MSAEIDARPRRVWGTLRFRVTMISTLALAVILVVASIALVVAQRRQLTAHPDDSLRRRADVIASALNHGDGSEAVASVGSEDVSVQVVDAEGDVIVASHDLIGEPAIAERPPADAGQRLHTVGRLFSDDDTSRVLTQRVETPTGPVVLHVVFTFDAVQSGTRPLIASLAVVVPILLIVLGALIWYLVGRTLRPIEAIRAEVADIGATDLHRRVPEPPGDDEVARLARTMNEMLDRVEGANERQQRFVADASHELRSPLTRMRSELEVDLAHPERANFVATHRSVLDETTHLQHLVDDLLHLARSDGGVPVGGREPVDLDDIVLSEAQRVRTETAGRVDVTRVSAAQVRGDPQQLARAVRNLTDNAARHARSTITFTLAEREQTAVLTVADDGPGIPADQTERIFERFTRLNDARTSGSAGAGLGLAITRDVVQRHGGTIGVDAEYERGTRFRVTLPLLGSSPVAGS